MVQRPCDPLAEAYVFSVGKALEQRVVDGNRFERPQGLPLRGPLIYQSPRYLFAQRRLDGVGEALEQRTRLARRGNFI